MSVYSSVFSRARGAAQCIPMVSGIQPFDVSAHFHRYKAAKTNEL